METPRTDQEANRISSDLTRMRIDGWNSAYKEMRLLAEEIEFENIKLVQAVESLWAILKERKCLDNTDHWELERMVNAVLPSNIPIESNSVADKKRKNYE